MVFIICHKDIFFRIEALMIIFQRDQAVLFHIGNMV